MFNHDVLIVGVFVFIWNVLDWNQLWASKTSEEVNYHRHLSLFIIGKMCGLFLQKKKTYSHAQCYVWLDCFLNGIIGNLTKGTYIEHHLWITIKFKGFEKKERKKWTFK